MLLTGPNCFKRTQGSIDNRGGLEAYVNSYENTWKVLDDAVAKGVDLPKLYFACGTDDMLFNGYQHFKEHAMELGLKAKFEEIPGYKHEWRFWDLTIEKALDYFEIKAPNAGNPF